MKLSKQIEVFGALLCALSLTFATSVSAGVERLESKDVAVVPVEEPFSWTGFYVGAHGGGLWTDYDLSSYETEVDVLEQFFIFEEVRGDRITPARVASPQGVPSISPGPSFLTFFTPGTDDRSDDSVIGGGQVGYQHQFGHFVVGVEGEFSGASSSSGATSFETSQATFFFEDEGFNATSAFVSVRTERKADLEWKAAALGRLGWANGTVQLYAIGGPAWADVKAFTNDRAATRFFFTALEDMQPVVGGFDNSIFQVADPNFFPFISGDHASSEKVLFGWTGGLGADWAFTKLFSIGVQYRHSDYGSETFHFNSRSPVFSGSTRVDYATDEVTFRINFLIGNISGP